MYELTPDYLADVERRARRYQGQWTGTAGSLAADCIRLLFDRRRLLEELATMSQQLEDANAQIRKAIEIRREAVAAGKSHEEWYAGMLESCCGGGKCHTTTTTSIDEKGPLPDVDEHIAEDDAATPEADMVVPVDWILQGERELEQSRAGDDIRWSGDSILASPPDGLRHEADNTAEQLLLDALAVIRDRRPKYGGPRHHFRRTVGMINAAFADVLKRPLTEADWAQFMLLNKVARYNGPAKSSDGPIDLAGYAACLAEVEADSKT